MALARAYPQSDGGQFAPIQVRQVAQDCLRHSPPPTAETGSSADVSLDCQDVLTRVASLPEAQRVALAWLTGGCSPADIAKGTAQPVEAVLENLRRGREALEQALISSSENEQDEWGYPDDDLSDTDADIRLNEVAVELAGTVEEADIAAAARAVLTAIQPRPPSVNGPASAGGPA